MAYDISVSDIESRWRILSSSESDVAATLLDDALALIDINRPLLADAVTSGQVSMRVVTMCAVDAVIRVLANPDRLSQQSITVDGSVSIGYQFEAKIPAPRLRLSDLDFEGIDQALSLVGLRTARTGSVTTVSTTSWNALRGGIESEFNSGLIPFATKSDTVGAGDYYSISVH